MEDIEFENDFGPVTLLQEGSYNEEHGRSFKGRFKDAQGRDRYWTFYEDGMVPAIEKIFWPRVVNKKKIPLTHLGLEN